MKQKDLVLIIVTGFISAVISLLLSNVLFAPPEGRQRQVEVVTPISSDFPEADKKYFNENAVDPTKLIQIGNNPNPDPFKPAP